MSETDRDQIARDEPPELDDRIDAEDLPAGPETPAEEEELDADIEQAEDEGMTDPDVPVPSGLGPTPRMSRPGLR